MKERTGIEEYAFQIIKHLRVPLKDENVALYVKEEDYKRRKFELPEKWKVVSVPYNYLWTQFGLSWEMLSDPADVLFVPAHTVPFIHPKGTVVTVHGLEYEHCPESYSGYSRWFHRVFVKRSCHWAKQIVAVSKNTREDLMRMYRVDEGKINVVYNGFDEGLRENAENRAPKGTKHFHSPSGSHRNGMLRRQ